MIKFRTAYSGDSSDFISDSGSHFLDQYEYEIDKDGVQNLVKIDQKKDVYSAIQADYPSTDINLLMKRFALGDKSAIDITQGFYVDATKMPKTLAEVFDRAQDCQEFFDMQDPELKAMFNNSYSEFFAELNNDTKSFADKISKYNEQFENHQFDVDDVESEVTPDES